MKKGIPAVSKSNARKLTVSLEKCAQSENSQTGLPPFFKALVDYMNSDKQSFHCPGHSSGDAFLKSQVGKEFYNLFGKNLFKSDVCNAVEELGQLLEHTGPIAESEKNAAEIFSADHLFFVTNGTSTSNKIIWQSQVGPDDIVIVDRNCHKSNLHAIMMTGATPVYLTPTRNHLGIIGPIPKSEFLYESIQKKIAKNPLIKDKTRKPRIFTLTQSTYDGVSYNVEQLKELLDGKVDALHFDEAWIPHAAFHPFYKDMHAIGEGRPRPKESMIYSAQSTHKFLAGLSQASQILVQESETKKLNRHLFNETYLMHTSTSPLYTIIASCDVTAEMMRQPHGKQLIGDVIIEAMNFRRAMRSQKELESKKATSWWFNIWGPKEIPDVGIGSREAWILKATQPWHGFGEVAEGFNMLDPIRTTILTPGLNLEGDFAEFGIPAPLVCKFLAENGVIVEKYGLYSMFVMFTMGTTQDKWKTLIKGLENFKNHFECNALVYNVMPKFAKSHPQYSDMTLKELSAKLHASYKAADIGKMTTETYLSEVTPEMKPADAYAKMVRGEVERVSVDELEGRVTAVLLTPYPPGIPLLVPGEKFNKAIVKYLKFAKAQSEELPGFETDVHGLVSEIVNGKREFFVDCVK